METKLTEEESESINNTKYRGMIGSLLYLMASRPDIMFRVCLCARFQEDPKTSHLEAVKRIFRYIKGTTHLGLWYPKGSGIETIVYADSDHSVDYVDRRALCSTEIMPNANDETISTSIEADMPSIRRINASQYAVSNLQNRNLFSESKKTTRPFPSRLNDDNWDELKETDEVKDLEAYYTDTKPLGNSIP
ncbi:hypothetical protein Tco_1052033 [Tanacetum coccineum]